MNFPIAVLLLCALIGLADKMIGVDLDLLKNLTAA